MQQFYDDHDQLRKLAEQISEVAWKRQLDVASNLQVRNSLRTFHWRLLEHIAREDGILLPSLMQLLSVDEGEGLMVQWKLNRTKEMAQLSSLTELNGHVHAWPDDLLLQHLEALTALDLTKANNLWQKFSDGLLKHAQAEGEFALPVYERLGKFSEGGHSSMFHAEHKTLRVCSIRLQNALKSFFPTDSSLRRKIVVNLDKYVLFRHLIEHHTLCEQNIFYPILDEKANGNEKASIAKVLSEAKEMKL